MGRVYISGHQRLDLFEGEAVIQVKMHDMVLSINVLATIRSFFI